MQMPDYFQNTVDHNMRSGDFALETMGLSPTEIINALAGQPVCPKCERLAFRDVGWKENRIATCSNCGWHGKTVTYDEYITKKLYR